MPSDASPDRAVQLEAMRNEATQDETEQDSSCALTKLWLESPHLVESKVSATMSLLVNGWPHGAHL